MLRGVLRTREGKIIAAILGLIIVTIVAVSYVGYSEQKQFAKQAVMAENYLKAGSYEQAVEAYLKALSTKKSDEQQLTIGLADAYVGMDNYDRALEVLRSCYQKTAAVKIKEKIEEVTSEKTDYQYLQSISHAEVFFTNKDYDKAIAEFEKAKLIKSKEATSYKRIAEAYIEEGEYDLAREEVLEGQALTGDTSLNETLAQVDDYLLKEQYDQLIAQASEYIYQENYKDGIKKYREAIELLPKESMAYQGMAEAYMTQGEYNKTILLLKKALELVDSDELQDTLSQATELKEAEEEKSNILTRLSQAFEIRDYTTAAALMDLTFFKENIVEETPVFYDNRKGDISKLPVMIIYDSNNIYYGDFNDNIRNGIGLYYLLTEGGKNPKYYCYDGKWNSDMPNGNGKTVEVIESKDDDGEVYVSKTVTEGKFYNSVENGIMTKIIYKNGKETGRVEYSAKKGIPIPILVEDDTVPKPGVGKYYIGEIYHKNKPTGEYYSVDSQTVWGVRPFMKTMK